MKQCTNPSCTQPINNDQANYCANCSSVLPATIIVAKSNNTLLYTIIGVLSLALLGVAAYFISNSGNHEVAANTNQPPVAISTADEANTAPLENVTAPATEAAPVPELADTPSIVVNNQEATTTAANTATATAAAAAAEVVEASPTQQLQNVGSAQLSREELANVSAKMKNYFNLDNAGNIQALLNCFAYPVKRYYDLKGASISQMENRFSHFMDNKLSYHNLTPDYNTSSVVRSGDGYSVTINGQYDWQMKESGKQGSKQVNLKFQLDNNYNITSIYE